MEAKRSSAVFVRFRFDAWRTRTAYLLLRRQLLYPDELKRREVHSTANARFLQGTLSLLFAAAYIRVPFACSFYSANCETVLQSNATASVHEAKAVREDSICGKERGLQWTRSAACAETCIKFRTRFVRKWAWIAKLPARLAIRVKFLPYVYDAILT